MAKFKRRYLILSLALAATATIFARDLGYARLQAQTKRTSSGVTIPLMDPAKSSFDNDPCAPGLTKAERLHRLAKFGAVRHIDAGRYQAGPHTVGFAFGILTFCK
jgi:hypothetical protein